MNNKNHALFIFDKKTPWMQRISDYVRLGHIYFICGQIEPAKVKFLAEKFAKNYETGLSKMEQSRKRKNGFASFKFLAWHEENANVVHWILCRTDGALPEIGSREKWQDATSKTRLHITGGYELVRLTKPEEPKPVWTWRYSRTHYEGLRESVLRALRSKRDDVLNQLIHEIWRSPGFAGARTQVKSIGKLIKLEWKRVRSSDKFPVIPPRIGYVRRIKDVGHVLK